MCVYCSGCYRFDGSGFIQLHAYVPIWVIRMLSSSHALSHNRVPDGLIRMPFTFMAWIRLDQTQRAYDNVGLLCASPSLVRKCRCVPLQCFLGHGVTSDNNGLHIGERTAGPYFGFYSMHRRCVRSCTSSHHHHQEMDLIACCFFSSCVFQLCWHCLGCARVLFRQRPRSPWTI